MLRRGVWVDDAPSIVLPAGYLDEVVGLGINVLAVMVDRPFPRWDPSWTQDQLEDLYRQAVVRRDLELVLTTWPYPARGALDDMHRGMRELLAVGAVAWEVDLEGLWMPRHLDGFGTLHEASDYLIEIMQDLAIPLDCRIEVTTHAHHPEAGARALVSPRADRLNVQAYSVAHRDGQPVPWHSGYGPGAMQRFAVARARSVPRTPRGTPRIGVGLAAWDQKWPGHDPVDAISRAYRAAADYHPAEIRFWSSKWILGKKRLEYAADAIGGLS